MSSKPQITHLPMVQNWDCHARGSCCKEYQVAVTDEEKKRIESQEWSKEDLQQLEPFKQVGSFWNRRTLLNHQEDGSCVFLNEDGRCRIHEKFGYEAKPLACRLFPFVLIPVADHWRVSMRFACPSAAENLGRPVPEHINDLKDFANQLTQREEIEPLSDGNLIRPPKLQPRRRKDWPDLLLLVDALQTIIRKRGISMERRMRICLTFAQECQNADLQEIQGERLNELLQIFRGSCEEETKKDPSTVDAPSWVGRVLFRQLLAVYLRKDHGPKRGIARMGRIALLKAALRFARGKGPLPKLHDWLPDNLTFEQIEAQSLGKPSLIFEEMLERYYSVKIGSVQFCGPASFGMQFWDGFEHLALTMPALLWVTRAFVASGTTPEEGLIKALSIIDDHFGFNPVLRTFRQRVSFRILARRHEIEKLIAHYAQ